MINVLHTEHCETQFFFDEKGKLLQWWNTNDANYRSEYMGPLFKSLGINMQYIEYNDTRIYKIVKRELKKQGYSNEDIDE